MKPPVHSVLFLLILALATPNALSASGGGANIGGAANTAEGTGRGAGGPGDGQGPGQGAGQGLGPGGKKEKPRNEETEREKKQREKKEREKAERAKKEKAEKEKSEREHKERREKDEREKTEREQKQREERERTEKTERERENNKRREKEKREQEPTKGEDNSDPAPKPTPGPGEQTTPQEDERPAQPSSEPTPEPARPEERKNSDDPSPLRPEPPMRDNPLTPRDSPLAPSRGDLPSVPTSPESFVPGGGRIDEALTSDPVSTVNNFFGGLFGGGKKRAAETAATVAASSGKSIIKAESATRARANRAPFLGLFRIEVPNLVQAVRVSRVAVDPRVTSPRTVTYKSRFSRVSRWIGPLTLGLLNYLPLETMNASVAGRINNVMAEEEIALEKTVARLFEEKVRNGRRYRIAHPADAVFELEMTRYALDPMPTSLGRMKPTVSITGRMYNETGQLLWIGKGFSTIVEPGINGATVEQYLGNPEALENDFATAIKVATDRLAAQANAVPKATVKVTAAE